MRPHVAPPRPPALHDCGVAARAAAAQRALHQAVCARGARAALGASSAAQLLLVLRVLQAAGAVECARADGGEEEFWLSRAHARTLARPGCACAGLASVPAPHGAEQCDAGAPPGAQANGSQAGGGAASEWRGCEAHAKGGCMAGRPLAGPAPLRVADGAGGGMPSGAAAQRGQLSAAHCGAAGAGATLAARQALGW